MSQTYTDLTETMFPDSMDQWDRYLDPTIQTISLITQYQNFYNQGKFEEANGVIEHNPILKRIIVNASTMNKTLDAIMALQRFYFSDFQAYLQNIIQLKGEYASTVKYPKYSVVTYIVHDNTEAFLCLSGNCPIGTPPTNTNFWTPWTARGEKGDSGTGLTPRGTYSITKDYYVNDMVSYNNVWWYATRDNVEVTPSESDRTWVALLKFSADLLTFDNHETTLRSSTFQNALAELAKRGEHVTPVTLTAAGWSETLPYEQTVDVPGGSAELSPIMVSMLPDGAELAEQKAYNKAFGILSSGTAFLNDGSATFKVYKKPAVDVTVGLKGV